MHVAVVEQGFHQKRHTASFEHVLGDITAARFQIRDIWCLFEDFGDVEQVEFDAAFMRDGRQMQRSICGTAGGGNHCGGVLQRLAGNDVARPDILHDQVHDHLAGQRAELVAHLVGRRRAGRIGQRQADRLGHGRHGVGGELRAAGPGRGAGVLFERLEILVRHLPDRMPADRLVDVLHGDVLAFELSGQDRPAIDVDRRHVEPAHRHHHAGLRLVAAGDADQRVVSMATHREFDRIGDHLARGQRGLHASMAHGDAVGDGYGAEFARRTADRGNPLLDRLRLAHQRNVARRGFVPAGGHAHKGLVDLLGRKPHGVIKRAMRGAVRPFGGVPARQLGF